MTDTIDYKIAFSMLSGINYSSGKKILGAVGTEENFFRASERELGALLTISSKFISREYRDSVLQRARAERSFVEDNRISLHYFTDDDYPRRLTECEDGPAMLYGLGKCDLNHRFVISIVGTRHATPYGLDLTQRIVSDLAEMLPEKPVVVSGLAYGIDIAAHRAALKCGCPTVAVLAHGMRTIYPSVHRRDAAKIIAQGGMLLSEYPSDAPVHRGNFLARNRIVAGLCDGLVVAESAVKGGALLTARLASAYHRDVMAVPGRTSDIYSAGCNRLITDNIAALIAGSEDLVNTLGWPVVEKEGAQMTLAIELSDDERAVIGYLTEHADASLNQISIHTGLGVSRTMSLLIDMEFKGLLLCYPGSRYRLT